MIKIIDFGIAKYLPNNVTTSTIAGTPGHMAPEVFANSTTKASDVFSFGVVMYVLIFKKYPFPVSFLNSQSIFPTNFFLIFLFFII